MFVVCNGRERQTKLSHERGVTANHDAGHVAQFGIANDDVTRRRVLGVNVDCAGGFQGMDDQPAGAPERRSDAVRGQRRIVSAAP